MPKWMCVHNQAHLLMEFMGLPFCLFEVMDIKIPLIIIPNESMKLDHDPWPQAGGQVVS